MHNSDEDDTSGKPEAQHSDLPQPEPPATPTPEEKEKEEERKRLAELEKVEREKQRLLELRNKSDDVLHSNNIFAYRMDYRDFIKKVWDDIPQRVDLVCSSLPDDFPIEKLDNLPSICDITLKPGGYAFFVLSEDQFTKLNVAFKNIRFKIMDYSFKIVYDSSTFQRRNVKDFPQRNADIALIARRIGEHPGKFKPLFCSSAGQEESGSQVRFASVLNIATCQDKLKKPEENSALFPGEKSIQLFEHVIRMLCPTEGTIFDPVAGALTAAIACINTGRQCYAVEEDPVLFSYAIGRLRIMSTPETSMQDLSDFSDPIDVDETQIKNTEEKQDNKSNISKRPSDEIAFIVDEEPSTGSELASGCSEKVDICLPNTSDSDVSEPRKRTSKRRKVTSEIPATSSVRKTNNDTNDGAEALLLMKSSVN